MSLPVLNNVQPAWDPQQKESQSFSKICFIPSLGLSCFGCCGHHFKSKRVMHQFFDENKKTLAEYKAQGKTDAQFQAEIILRSIEAYKEAGVDAVFVFNGCDENSGTDGGQFESCGLFTSQADGYKPTAASEAMKAYLKPPQAAQRNIERQSQLPKISSGKRPMK